MQACIRRFLFCFVLLLGSTAFANTIYVVKPGDYLGKIAQENGCTVSDIVRWNPGLNPDRIHVGQRITIRGTGASNSAETAPNTYTVQSGDTLGGIAAKNNVSLQALMAANPKVDAERLQIGQQLQLPRASPSTGATGTTPGSYSVVSGDTMMKIASKLGVSYNALLAANRNVDPDRLQIGQQLRVPDVSASASTDTSRMHVVVDGDTISAIAAQYGVSIEDLQAWNKGLNPDRIRVGQRIHIQSARPIREVVYTIVQGDILGRIAERHDVTVSELVQWNPKLDPDRISIGQKIRIFKEGPTVLSESAGTPASGKLINGEQLTRGAGFRVHSPRRAWGTNDTITRLHSGYDHVVKSFQNVPRISIHDISKKDGGPLKPHASHQSGRDVDAGYYHSGCGTRDCPYQSIRASQLNAAYQWALFSYWIDRGWVQYIFMDYTLQEPLYNYAKSQGVSESTLRKVFQYPRGRHSHHGIIRHWPGHSTHYHVRFQCNSGDKNCR